MTSNFTLTLKCDNCDKVQTRASDATWEPWVRGYVGIYLNNGKDCQRRWDACQTSCVPGAVAKMLGDIDPAWRPVT